MFLNRFHVAWCVIVLHKADFRRRTDASECLRKSALDLKRALNCLLDCVLKGQEDLSTVAIDI